MELRPTPKIIRKIIKETPDHKQTLCYAYRYKRGGLLQYEEEYIEKYKDVNINQPITFIPPKEYIDALAEEKQEEMKHEGVLAKWVYVGEGWWCRTTKVNSTGHEFGRLYAVDNDTNQPIELWDYRKHFFTPPPEVVFKDGKEGFIVGRSRDGILVEWLIDGKRSLAEPNKFDGLTFKYREDHLKYRRMFIRSTKNETGK